MDIKIDNIRNPFAQTMLDAMKYADDNTFSNYIYTAKMYLKREANKAKVQGYDFNEFFIKCFDFCEMVRESQFMITYNMERNIKRCKMPEYGKKSLIKIIQKIRESIRDNKDVFNVSQEDWEIVSKACVKCNRTANPCPLGLDNYSLKINVNGQKVDYSSICQLRIALDVLKEELKKELGESTPVVSSPLQLIDLITIQKDSDKEKILQKIDKYIEPKTAKQIYIIETALRNLNYIDSSTTKKQIHKAIRQLYNIKLTDQAINQYKDKYANRDKKVEIEKYINYLKL